MAASKIFNNLSLVYQAWYTLTQETCFHYKNNKPIWSNFFSWNKTHLIVATEFNFNTHNWWNKCFPINLGNREQDLTGYEQVNLSQLELNMRCTWLDNIHYQETGKRRHDTYLWNVYTWPEQLQMFPHLLRLVLGVEYGQLREHAHVSPLQPCTTTHHTLSNLSSSIEIIDQFVWFLQ